MSPYFRIFSLALVALSAACGGGGGGNSTPPPVNTTPPPPPDAPALAVERAFSNISFNQPVALKQAPGDSGTWYVVEQSGMVRAFANDDATSVSSAFLDITATVNDNFSEAGLLGLAFHPNYPATPYVYVSYTGEPSLTSIVARYELDNTGQALDPASEVVLLQITQPQGNHNGGDLAFGPDGLLYASFGDGGGGGDPGENAQNTGNLLGTIIRVDVDGAMPYEIPTDNPFAGGPLCDQTAPTGSDCPEIFAWGLRNPWRMSFDSVAGDLWLGDVGQGDWEEIDRVVLGGNYGWNDREGAHCFDPPTGCADTFEEPITEYDHGLGQSVTGGYVYRGTAIADLAGWYVFGDFVSGALFAVDADAQPTVTPDEVGDAGFNISAFAEDTDGELYAVDYGAGTLHRLIADPN